MMEILQTLLQFNYIQFQSFILVVVRFSGLFVSAPVFSNSTVPPAVKIGLSLFLVAIVFPFIAPISQPITHNWLLAGVIVKEFFVGVFFGFLVSLVFMALQFAGQLVDYQIGFGMVNIVDPESNIQVPVVGQFLYILGMLFFLIIGGHHLIIKSLVRSFEVLPLGLFKVDRGMVLFLNRAFAETFVLAFKIAAPAVGAVFVSEMAYGVMARAIPQMNILIVGLPLKIGLGVFFLYIGLPLFFWLIRKEFFNVFLDIKHLCSGL